jgi:hypothetical protein
VQPGLDVGRAEEGVTALQLDDHTKQLLRELGHEINENVSGSQRIAEAISNIRAAGFDIVLRVNATISLARRESQDLKMASGEPRFLESLHIQIDVNEENREEKLKKCDYS